MGSGGRRKEEGAAIASGFDTGKAKIRAIIVATFSIVGVAVRKAFLV